MDESTTIFEGHRPRLFQLAYGMLGRVAPAEDAVQEAYLRWQNVDLEKVDSPAAYLSTIVSRLCLDHQKSAQNPREEYVGPDLPEPLLESNRATPEQHTELSDSFSMAFLVLLKNLTPVQRAVFLLREVFDYDYAHIADSVEKSEAHCRKIAQRAREHIRENRPRFETDRKQKKQLLKSFMEAVKTGNISELEQMLAEEAILYSDGGGKVTAARKPVFGPNNIIRFMVGIRKNTEENEVDITFTEVNGEPGMLAFIDGALHSVWTFDIKDDEIRHIFILLNPDKLDHIRQNL